MTIVSSMRTLFLVVICLQTLLGAGYVGKSWACGPDWTFVGNPPYMVLCIQGPTDDSDHFLAGTWRGPNTPNSGGVFRYTGQDTTWEYVGLAGQRVHALERFPNLPGSLFAATSGGLFRTTDEGATWSFVMDYGTFLWNEQTCFRVSPFDSNEWAVGFGSPDGEGGIVLSFDGGQTWDYFYIAGYTSDLGYSRYTPGVLFEAMESVFLRRQTVDSTMEIVFQLIGQDVVAMAPHPTQPWWYVLGEDTLIRYNELDNELIGASLPPEAQHHGWGMEFAPGYGALVGTRGGVFLYDETLQHWDSVNGGAPYENGAFIHYASLTAWVSEFRTGLYCRAHRTGLAPPQPSLSSPSMTVYPNPARNQVLLVCSAVAQIEFFNVLGQRIASAQVTSPEQVVVVSVAGWSAGTYFYSVQSTTNRSTPISGVLYLVK